MSQDPTPDAIPNDDQIHVPNLQPLRGYSREEVSPEFEKLMTTINERFKNVAHFLTTTVEFLDPALIMLATNHAEGTCRLGQSEHVLAQCLGAQHQRWMSKMNDIASQQDIKLPSFTKAEEDEISVVLARRAEELLEHGAFKPVIEQEESSANAAT